MDEKQIIQAIINGSDEYAKLIERYHVGLIIHCERILKNRTEAEDIAQEAFIKAYFDLKHYDSERSRFSTWLYRIATNQCIDYLRKQKHKVAVDDIESVAELTMPMHIEREERMTLRTAVTNLSPPENKYVMEGYYWQGKSYAEMASEMGIPLNTVRTWIRRAKLQLQKDLL